MFRKALRLENAKSVAESNQPAVHEHVGSGTFLSGDTGWRVRTAVFRHKLRRRVRPISHRIQWLRALRYEAWLELRSCWFRIGTLRGTTMGFALGPATEMSSTEHLVQCRQTFGHMQGIQSLLSNRSRARLEGEGLFPQGWETGAEWAPHGNGIPHFCTGYTVQKATANSPS